MRHMNLILLIATIATLSACAKAGKEVAEELGIVPSSCGSDGARMQATVDGATFCADGHIMAVSDHTSANISGIGLLGNTITLQVDTLAEGTYVIDEAENAVLFMALGTPYVSMADQPGTLSISSHNATDRRLKASFEATVRNEMNGTTKPISGTVDVTYSVTE